MHEGSRIIEETSIYIHGEINTPMLRDLTLALLYTASIGVSETGFEKSPECYSQFLYTYKFYLAFSSSITTA